MRIFDHPFAFLAAVGRAAIARPLSRGEIATASLLLLAGGTVYCAIYCRVAFYPMHEGGMPLWLSAWWATSALLPWFLAFEAVKRTVPRLPTKGLAIIACLGIAAATAAATMLAHWLANIDIMKMSASHWPSLLANQLQPLVLFALLVGLWTNGRSRDAATEKNGADNYGPLPPLSAIDWIRAAGNYVELKCGERLLIRRMTMREAEAATGSAEFVRIHRSIIVRTGLIEGFSGPGRSRALLTTGETLPVGDSYRRAVERIVPSSHDSALRHSRL